MTGGSHGIGAAIAERLVGDGSTVIINYSGDTSMLAFLVGADGGWVNRQVLRANGGMV